MANLIQLVSSKSIEDQIATEEKLEKILRELRGQNIGIAFRLGQPAWFDNPKKILRYIAVNDQIPFLVESEFDLLVQYSDPLFNEFVTVASVIANQYQGKSEFIRTRPMVRIIYGYDRIKSEPDGKAKFEANVKQLDDFCKGKGVYLVTENTPTMPKEELEEANRILQQYPNIRLLVDIGNLTTRSERAEQMTEAQVFEYLEKYRDMIYCFHLKQTTNGVQINSIREAGDLNIQVVAGFLKQKFPGWVIVHEPPKANYQSVVEDVNYFRRLLVEKR